MALTGKLSKVKTVLPFEVLVVEVPPWPLPTPGLALVVPVDGVVVEDPGAGCTLSYQRLDSSKLR